MLTQDQYNLWEGVKKRIQSQNSTNKPLQIWFEPTKLIEIQSSEDIADFIKLGVPTDLHKYWITENLLPIINQEISKTYSREFRIELIVSSLQQSANIEDGPKNYSKKNSKDGQGSLFDLKSPRSNQEIEKYGKNQINSMPYRNGVQSLNSSKANYSTPTTFPSKKNKTYGGFSLNGEYTFATFVVGRNNEFAHAACHSIADNPGKGPYNPLFICGPTGMGKTHLLNSVGNHLRSVNPQIRICYASAERFLNECISNIRRNEMHKFRTKYREKSDIFLMDDIQILGRGEAVQEEFFHTLNEYLEKGLQVVVASDRMPKDIKGLEDRIRTRLEWGVIADIQMPDIETRMAILKYKAESQRIKISSMVIQHIARISKRSIRELEGNLNKVKMYSDLQGLSIDLDLCKQVLSSHDESSTITIEDIQKMVASHYKIRVVDLKSKNRTKVIVTARQIAMHLIKKHLDLSYVEIGKAFGGKDHTTVMNALKRVKNQHSQNIELRSDIDDLENRIHSITGV